MKTVFFLAAKPNSSNTNLFCLVFKYLKTKFSDKFRFLSKLRCAFVFWDAVPNVGLALTTYFSRFCWARKKLAINKMIRSFVSSFQTLWRDNKSDEREAKMLKTFLCFTLVFVSGQVHSWITAAAFCVGNLMGGRYSGGAGGLRRALEIWRETRCLDIISRRFWQFNSLPCQRWSVSLLVVSTAMTPDQERRDGDRASRPDVGPSPSRNSSLLLSAGRAASRPQCKYKPQLYKHDSKLQTGLKARRRVRHSCFHRAASVPSAAFVPFSSCADPANIQTLKGGFHGREKEFGRRTKPSSI